MDKDEFVEYLANYPNRYEWVEGEQDGKPGLFVKNKNFETMTHFTWAAVERYEAPVLIATMHHGKNIEHITRVTGFFSRVSSWNRGKKGELRDRHRFTNLDLRERSTF